MVMLKKYDILRGLSKIDAKAKEAGVIVDLSIYGGAALALAFDIRRATRDVDAVVHGSPNFLRGAAVEVAQEEGWPEDWLNDGVKGFTSAKEQMSLMEVFEASPVGGLRIHLPSPEYLFAMKCMSMRPEGIDGSHDISDIEALADEAGIKDSETALSLVEAFYPSARIPPKVRFGVEEIMERLVLRHAEEAREREHRIATLMLRPGVSLDDFLQAGRFNVDPLKATASYTGTILWTDGDQAVQSLGRGHVIIHDVSDWPVKPVVSKDSCTIDYRNGKPSMALLQPERSGQSLGRC